MRWLIIFVIFTFAVPGLAIAQSTKTYLCLDGFCIGQPISAARFDEVTWLKPEQLRQVPCEARACQPDIAFRGYPPADRVALASAFSWVFTAGNVKDYAIITTETLRVFRRYRYECNPQPRNSGQRRFIGAFRSSESGHPTIVGLRLIDGTLTVYRIAREIPFENGYQFKSLADAVRAQYGNDILLIDYLSSNAYSEVNARQKLGWFGRSSVFNTRDPADNRAELVIIDPKTRPLLSPSSMPYSGEIGDLPVRLEKICEAPVSLQ